MLHLLWMFGILLICVLIKIRLKLTIARHGCYTCLVGKTVIVTGSNTGLGFYTALEFASRGAKVILACRNGSKAEDAQRRIIRRTKNSNVFVELVDFASLKSVRDFAGRIKSKEDKLDILVNNAGVILFEDTITEDGLSMSMQVNYFAPFLLTALLIGDKLWFDPRSDPNVLDLLKRTGNGRIVNISSVTAFYVTPQPDNLNHFDSSLLANLCYTNYANTKLNVTLWTNELAKRLQHTGVTANSLHPGIVHTQILRHSPIKNALFKCTKFLYAKTQEEGVQTTVYVAISNDTENVSGKYFQNCRRTAPPKLVLDGELAKKIWQNTETLVKLTLEERLL